MTPREQFIFAQGFWLGAALALHEQQQEIAVLDDRLHKIEQRPRLWRCLRRLVPSQRRDFDGVPLYRLQAF